MKRISTLYLELIGWIGGLLLSGFLLHRILLGQTTLIHDNFYWNYPVFQFFAESLANGFYPFWDPFMHGGEPFFTLIPHFRLLEPICLFTIYAGKFFTSDAVLLFNWYRFIQSLIALFGIYLVLRPWARYLFVRLSLIAILLFSSTMLGSFQQDAIINQFLWIPYITFFLLRITYYGDNRWGNWLLLSILIGLNWQSLFFTGTWLFMLFFILGLAFFYRQLILQVIRKKNTLPKIVVSTTVILLMMAPNIVLMMGKDELVFPARMLNTEYHLGKPLYGPQQFEGMPEDIVNDIVMNYDLVTQTSTSSTIWDFIQTISPAGNSYLRWKGYKRWGNSSEAFIYFGILPWLIIVFGIVFGKHPLKRLWVFVLIMFALLMLGPPAGLHKILFYIYPPIWFVRHTHSFVLFFSFTALFFYVLGANYLLDLWQMDLFRFTKLKKIFFNSKWRSLIFMGILLVQFFATIYYSENSSKIFMTFFLILLPLVTLPLLKDYLYQSYYLNCKATLLILLGFILLIDLIYFFNKSETLYNSRKNPGLEYNINTHILEQSLVNTREILPKEISPVQSMRYISLITRIPSVFSPILEGENEKVYVHQSKWKKFDKDLLPGSFEYGLKKHRWNSLILLRNYLTLIHSGIPPEAMKEMFAVDKPLFQLKKGTIPMEDGKVFEFLKRLGPEKSVHYLNNYIFIEKNSDSTSKINLIEGVDSIPIRQKEEILDYKIIIKDQTYNTFNIEIHTDKASALYFSDGYTKEWKATLNGKETPMFRANINFKAIDIPKGTSVVQFTYDPILFKRSLFVFYGSFIISLLLAGGTLLNRRRFNNTFNDKITDNV